MTNKQDELKQVNLSQEQIGELIYILSEHKSTMTYIEALQGERNVVLIEKLRDLLDKKE